MGIGSRFIASAAFATALVAGTTLGSNRASATTLYNNLSAESGGVVGASVPFQGGPNSYYGPLFESFSTGASALYFDSVKLLLNAYSPDDGETFTVSLLSDNFTHPGTVLGFSGPQNDNSLSTDLGVVSFTPAASISLTANKLYWIELSSTGSVNWSFTNDDSGVGVVGGYFKNYAGIFDNSMGPYQMQVDASVNATPLPTSWTIMLIGLAGLGLLAAHRRRKNGFAGFAAD